MKGFTFDLQCFADHTFTYDADAENPYILDGTGYATASEAFKTLVDGDKVTLASDVDINTTSYVSISGGGSRKTITLDLNGHKWTRTAKGSYVFYTATGGHLVVEDSSEAKTGEIAVAEDIVETGSSSVIMVMQGGSFTLNSGKIVNYGKDADNNNLVYGICVNGAAGSFDMDITINGGSVETPNNTGEKSKAIFCNGNVDCTTVTVNEGATITGAGYGVETNANLIVNGGTIETTGDKAAVNVLNTTAAATAKISGGTIKSAGGVAVNFGAANGSLTVDGGTIDGDITVNSESTLDVADSYSSLVKIPATVDGQTVYYSADEWAQVQSTLVEKTVDQATQYFTADGWAQVQSNVLVPTLSKSGTTAKVTFADGETFVEGTNLIEAKLDGVIQYFTTVANCQTLLKSCNLQTLDGENLYFRSNVWNALEKVSVALDNRTTYFTPAYWENLKDSLLTAEINDATRYFTTEAKLTSTVKTYIAVTVDDTTKYYTNTANLNNAVKNLVAVTIDGGDPKYYTSQELADAAINNSDCVAKIGNNAYTTLTAAVNAVSDGETITLLKDATGDGVKVTSGKNFTLDFGGHTYTVDGTTVGSAGTETQAFQLLKDSDITFKNGTITSSKALMLVQNYSNLTLDNMTLDGSKLIGDAPFTSSNNNGTVNVTGNTSIIAKTGGYAFDVSFANTSYPNGAQVTIDTTGTIGAINFNTWSQGGTNFAGSLTVKNGTIGEITVDDDALTLGAVDKITITGGTFANKSINADATLLVVDNVLVAEGWNETANGFTYVAKPESGSVGVTAITVSDIDSVDDIKFDAAQKVFVVPNTAKTSAPADGYKLVTVTYDGTTATVSTDATDIKINANLLADDITKISAAGNRTALDISGGDKVNSLVGGTKNDTLASANTGSVTMTGGDGSDIFVAGGNLTVTDYTVGEDKISVKANAGNPNVATNGNNLVLTFGSDTVNLLDAADKIVAVTKGTEIFYYNRDGETLSDGSAVTLDADIKTYTVKDPIKHVDGSQTTNLKLTGDTLDNSLTGGAGNVKLSGDKGDDTLVATGGNTTMTGGKGDDLFVRGTGNAHITDYSASGTNGEDKIFVEDDPTSFKFNGNNLVLTFDDDKTLTVTGAKNKALTFVDDNGSTVRTYINDGVFVEDSTVTLDEKFKGSGYNVAKNDDIRQIDASKVAVKVNLVGNNAGNTLKGGSGNDTLTGGTGDDEFTGGTGSDTFTYGGGTDTVTDYESEIDTVKLNRGHTIQSATFGTDVVFNFDDGNFTLKDAADKTVVVKDASNKVWLYSQDFVAQGSGVTLQSAATEFDASSDVWKNLVTIDGSAANATIVGNAKNNVITGSGQLGGSAGNDTLTGGDGSDTFVYTAGKDVVTNCGDGDTVSLGGDLTFTDITASKAGGQKVTFTVGKGTLTFNNAPAQISLVDANGNTATLSDDGLTTDTTKQVFNGTKEVTADGDLTVDARNVKNAVTINASDGADIFGNAGKTVFNYAGGTVKIENFAAGDKINHGELAITEVTADKITFGDAGTIELVDHDADTKVQLTGTNDKGKSVTSTVYLGEGALYDNTPDKATKASVTSDFTASGKIKTVTALGTNAIQVTGNDAGNTLTANDAGSTLDGGTGTDVLIGGNGADVFIHDKLTGTTTINGFTLTDRDAIKLGDDLTVVGSAYSPGAKNGTLTLTVEGSDAGKSVTSKIVIKSDDFSKTASPNFGTIVLDGDTVSFGKNAIYYSDDEVKLLSTFGGKFTATASTNVDGSDVTGTLTINGSAGDDTLTGGANKSTLAGGKGDDSLIGGTGADVFTYAAGDGSDVIANFAYNDDKLKVTKAKLVDDITFSGGKLTFSMTDGGSVTINDLDDNILLKADDTLYWFNDDKLVTAGDTVTKNKLSAIVKAPTDYALVELDYGTNLVTAKLAEATATTFNANDFKKTT